MIGFVGRRLAATVITLLVVSVTVFVVTEIIPGDVIEVMLGRELTPEAHAALSTQLGLDRPALERYFTWLGDAVRGDLGHSIRLNASVNGLILDRLYNSMILAGVALVIGVPLAIGLAIISAHRRNRAVDHAIMASTLGLVSVPQFVVGALLVLVFAVRLQILPPISTIDVGAGPLSRPEQLILPAITTMVTLLAYITRMTRTSIIAVLDSGYVRTARLKGLSRRSVIFRHTLRNALIPTVTIITMNIGWLVGGLVVVETIFAYPGLGRLMMFAIENRDLALLQGVTLVVAAIYAIANLIGDLLYGVLNPRIRLS